MVVSGGNETLCRRIERPYQLRVLLQPQNLLGIHKDRDGWTAVQEQAIDEHQMQHHNVAPSLPMFRHFFVLYGFKSLGWYHFRSKDTAATLFKGMTHTCEWKEAFFFLKSPTPWPCAVNWGEPAKTSTVEPVLTKEENIMVKKLLCVHGGTVDIKTYLSESNLAAAMITDSSANPPSPLPTTRATSSASAKGLGQPSKR
ncbi:hypothetical protein ACP4OV_025169 [Aristida adscensionis]